MSSHEDVDHEERRRRTATIFAHQETSQRLRNSLADVFRGKQIDGFVPTLEQRVRAAIALSNYNARRLLAPKGAESEAPQQMNDDTLVIRTALLCHTLLNSPEPPKTVRARATHEELPHEFLARLAAGEPINGYLPPMRLRRIAAAATLPYCMAKLRAANVEANSTLAESLDEMERRGLFDRPLDRDTQIAVAANWFVRWLDRA